MSSKPQLVYLDIRGRAEAIRLLLEEVGVEYQDLQLGPSEWAELKPTTPFGQVPLFREGDLELAQTFAILAHLARRHDLSGQDEAQRLRCDTAIEAIRDADGQLGAALWRPDFAQQRASYVEIELAASLSTLARFFLAGRANAVFWAGASLTLADVVAFAFLENVDALQAARGVHPAEIPAEPPGARGARGDRIVQLDPLESCKGEPWKVMPAVDRNRCEAKDDCVRVCPCDVFEIRALSKQDRAALSLFGKVKAWVHGGKQAFVVRPDACHACQLCIEACPEDALTLVRNVASDRDSSGEKI